MYSIHGIVYRLKHSACIPLSFTVIIYILLFSFNEIRDACTFKLNILFLNTLGNIGAKILILILLVFIFFYFDRVGYHHTPLQAVRGGSLAYVYVYACIYVLCALIGRRYSVFIKTR